MPRVGLSPFLVGSFGLAVGLVACSWESSELAGDAGGDGAQHVSMDGAHDGGLDARRHPTRDAGPAIIDEDPPDGPFVMAKHPPLPQLVNFGAPGQGVLTAPTIVTITFAGDPMAAAYEKLGSGIASSTWWDAVRAGYCDHDGGPCIGDGPPGVAVELTTPPAKSYTDNQIQALLESLIDTGVVPMPDPNRVSETMYVFYFPESTVVRSGGMSCYDFFGYHSFISHKDPADAGGKKQLITYAVVDECSIPSADGGIRAKDTVAYTTETTSHEVMETATDPVNGFSLDYGDPNSWGWSDILGVEVGDLCDWYGPPPSYNTWPGENIAYDSSLTVQRIWSNPQAAAGLDPCLPVPAGVVFFEVAPPQNVLILDVGGSITFDAVAYSTGPIPDWTVLATDFTPTNKPYLSITIAGATDTKNGPTMHVNNGDVLKVTVTLLHDPGNTPNGEADGVFVSYAGSADQPTAAYEWPFVVLSPADALDAGIDAAISMRPVHKHMPGSPMPRRPSQ